MAKIATTPTPKLDYIITTQLNTLLLSSLQIEEEEREGEEKRKKETDSEEEELTDQEEDWSTSSYIFPTEQLPTPISETPRQSKFSVPDLLPKKVKLG
jgi:hypothetical protein